MRRAFTLIELMVVVAIIGILASIAVPNFLKFSCRAKKTEGKTGLNMIAKAEEAYRAENDVYAYGTEGDIFVGALMQGRRYYDFEVFDPGGSPPAFFVEASGLPGSDVAGDFMTIDSNFLMVVEMTDVCR